MKRPTETDLVRACIAAAQSKGCFVWRNNTTGVFDPTTRRFRKFTGMKGVADILGVMPGGRLLAVECKMPKGVVSPDQKLFLAAVSDMGGLAFVARDVQDVLDKL